jgi:hypothetical protein
LPPLLSGESIGRGANRKPSANGGQRNDDSSRAGAAVTINCADENDTDAGWRRDQPETP